MAYHDCAHLSLYRGNTKPNSSSANKITYTIFTYSYGNSEGKPDAGSANKITYITFPYSNRNSEGEPNTDPANCCAHHERVVRPCPCRREQ